MAGQHCGAEGDWRSKLVPDRWPPKGVNPNRLIGAKAVKPVPISVACKRHDDCYDKRGANRSKCDKRFLKDMRSQCDHVYKSMFDVLQRGACRAAAKGYYKAVVKYGQPAFASAQAKYKKKEEPKATQPAKGKAPEEQADPAVAQKTSD